MGLQTIQDLYALDLTTTPTPSYLDLTTMFGFSIVAKSIRGSARPMHLHLPDHNRPNRLGQKI